MASESERRGNNRILVRLPVELEGGGTGMTRDASPSGVYFESDARYAEGSEISFLMKFDNADCAMVCMCKARVVRVENQGAKTGIAAHILESRFQPAAGSTSAIGYAQH